MGEGTRNKSWIGIDVQGYIIKKGGMPIHDYNYSYTTMIKIIFVFQNVTIIQIGHK